MTASQPISRFSFYFVCWLFLILALAACQPSPAPTPSARAFLLVSATPRASETPISPTPVLASATPGPTATSKPTDTPRPPASPTASPTATPTKAAIHSLDDVFAPPKLAGLDPARLRVILATGDVVPARSVDTVIRRRGNDFLYTVAATKDILKAAGLTVVNMESPLVQGCPPHDEGYIFCAQPGFVTALQAGGVDVVTLENNHIGNYGAKGIQETIERLQDAGITPVTRLTPALKNVRGLRVGIVAFSGVGYPYDRPGLTAAIQALRPQVDIVIGALHWGAEYVALPEAAPGVSPDNPVDIAHLAIDAGADLIIGNNPHWVQAVEVYKDKFIAYAHGNFIFDQMWSYETRVGVLGKYTFYDNALVGVEFIPTLLENYAQPVPLKGQAAQAVLDNMAKASHELAQRLAK